MADLIGRYSAQLEEIPGDFRRKAISASQAPGTADREALAARRDELAAALRPGRRAHAPAMAELQQAFPGYGADDLVTAATIDSYVEALTGLPAWAVARAVRRFRDGTAVTPWDRNRCPTEPQVAAEARLLMRPVEAELHRITTILDASILPDPSPEERAKVAKLAADLAAHLRQPPGAENAEAHLARIAEGGMGGLKLDPGIAARMRAKAGSAVPG
ncbi:hypothetical protein [Methylobacterium sp. JK268]